MEQPSTALNELQSENDRPSPDTLLREFRERNEALNARFDKILESIQQIRSEIQQDAESGLARLSQAAVDMMNGRVYQYIDIQAKGELGILVKTFNQTLTNLQQLDASVKDQTTKVPELAAQLDAITADTEEATQNVMNRLDTLMATADDASRFFSEIQKNTNEYKVGQEHLITGITNFLERARDGESHTVVAQEILDYVFEFQVAPRPQPLDLTEGQNLLRTVSDEAFEILNILQFQDITRQKTEQIVLMLKQFRQSLDRLLEIFKIKEEEQDSGKDVFENRNAATQNNIFNTGVIASTDTGSVDDIIAKYKANQ
ncbi:MAG: HAMP domain-containing protein [Holophagales bacterium]|jgi:chemotaxis regulatin CheY-phosphate phosphatase CheZ|nr:HAMP domain-containing protein [Holophagales bacterium]